MPICSSSPWRKHSTIDAFLVDVRAVERPLVAHDVALRRPLDGDVAPRHGDVVEHDVGVGVSAEQRGPGTELEPLPRLRTSTDDEHGAVTRQ